nr:hypothetical protein [Pseudoxanthomonas sp.]
MDGGRKNPVCGAAWNRHAILQDSTTPNRAPSGDARINFTQVPA